MRQTMNRKRYTRAIVLLLGTLIINGCLIPSAEPTTEVPESIPTAALAEIPTATAQPATAVVETPSPDWERYVNADYGFAFRYPTTWTLEEEQNLIKLSQGTLLLAIAFQRQDEDVPPAWTGMPAGTLENRGTLEFLGQEIEKSALVYEGNVKVLTYDAQVGEVRYAIRLDDMAMVDYQAIEISAAAQNEADQIVGSFALVVD